MKKLSTLSLCFTFTGCFLGAGYMSGQEIHQFFGAFGLKGVFGLIFAVAVLWLLGVILVRLVSMTGVSDIDKTVVGGNSRPALFAVGAAEILMLFGTFFVMIAGAGALIEQIFPFPYAKLIGSALFTLLLAYLALHGINGLIRIFSGAVPLLVLFSAVLGSISLVKMLPTGITFPVSTEFNPMIPNFAVGALAFSAYNFFCCVGVMCQVGLRVGSRRSVITAIGMGSLCLFAVAFGVILSMAANEGSAEAQIPMLYAANALHPIFGDVFAFLLMLAMIGAGLSCLIPTVTYFSGHFKTVEKHKTAFTALISLLGFALGSFGFSDLVGSVFSSFGFISLFIIFGVVRHYIKVKNKAKRENAGQ